MLHWTEDNIAGGGNFLLVPLQLNVSNALKNLVTISSLSFPSSTGCVHIL